MVCRLIQAEQVRRIGHQLGKRQARLLPAGEDADALLDRVAGEQKGAKKLAHLGGAQPGGDERQLPHDRVGRVKRLDLVLREVGDLDVAAQLAMAALEWQDPSEDLEQGRLAGAIRADERHLLAALQLQVEALIDDVVAVLLVNVAERDDGAAGAWRLRKAELDALGSGRRHDHAVDALQLLDAALHLARLGGLIAEALDERLGVRDLALLSLGRRLQLRQPLLALLDEVGVVADVLGQAAVVQLRHAVDHHVDEIAVVADQHDRSGVVGQERLQPFDARQVKVVGRLVEQQHVGVLQQQPGERHAHHPAA